MADRKKVQALADELSSIQRAVQAARESGDAALVVDLELLSLQVRDELLEQLSDALATTNAKK